MSEIKHPFGDADVQVLTASGAQALTIVNGLTLVDGVTVEADSTSRTLDLTIDDDLKAGALLLVQSKTNGAETTIFGTGITGATITGVAGKTINALFIYDGSGFVQAGAEQQID